MEKARQSKGTAGVSWPHQQWQCPPCPLYALSEGWLSPRLWRCVEESERGESIIMVSCVYLYNNSIYTTISRQQTEQTTRLIACMQEM